MKHSQIHPRNQATNRTRVGVVVTIAYLVFIGAMYYWNEQSIAEMDLNSMGDYFAGVFGPLAFGWLVLGYLQQGDELRLQAQELRHAVDQARELVSANRQQAREEQARHDRLLERQRAAAQPFLTLNANLINDAHEFPHWRLVVSNTGATCADVTLTFQEPIKALALGSIKRLTPSSEGAIDVHFINLESAGTCTLHFRDAMEQQQTIMFSFFEFPLATTRSIFFQRK
ncbi:MAG: hypothetical protein I8H71_01230 [Xanthomonadaceae bacterium]|nr:hypothetical protein [Xanthomonadaceae bacterium]